VLAQGLDFEAEKGTGQGDIPSPLNWDAFFDILLTALDTVKGGEICVQDRAGTNHPLTDEAYADDLFSIQSSLDTLQRKADVVSAICLFSEVQLSHTKFRAFSPNWGNAARRDLATPPSITVYGKGWTPTTVPVKMDGTAKYLGVRLDMDMSHSSNFTFTEDMLREKTAIIVSRMGSADTKHMVMRRSLVEKVAYHGKFMPWDLAQYERLDAILNAAYRRITKNMHSFPGALLALPHSQLGLGLNRFSDVSQERKASLVQRMPEGGTNSRVGMDGLMVRGLHSDGVGPIGPTSSNDFVPPNMIVSGWWSTSLRAKVDGVERSSLCNRRRAATGD